MHCPHTIFRHNLSPLQSYLLFFVPSIISPLQSYLLFFILFNRIHRLFRLRMDSKIRATSVAHLRRSAMVHAASISGHIGALVDGAADPDPEQWRKRTNEEKSESDVGSWPGVITDIKPPNPTLYLYGEAAFERVMHEFCCATYSIECPQVSREKVANILLAHAGRGGGITEAAAEIARATARSWLALLLDISCDRLAYVLVNLFDLAIERNRSRD
ncbi:Dynamin-related protein 5a [Thalictrum thalictroides]|uniref:Dynamin-related protein 5a n=1 Tax=Thalictrum thalictroides TaxID=46969 RepID=A0A7J6X4L2_THATH|nr:Dynamin-related protein 5a [Thalictrum thalictroides]